MAETPFEYFGGIEGGASFSKFSLVRSDGEVIATTSGGGTNQYIIGVDECLRRINAIVMEGLQKAGLPDDTILEGLGISLSGLDEVSAQEMFIATLNKHYPSLACHIFMGSDTRSALATALPEGGIILIAGTGSNCQLVNPDGSMARSGGWGHAIGDESSACWISLRAIKIFFDHEDNFEKSDHDVETVKRVIFGYFKIKSRGEILDHLYAKFDKAQFSGLCKELAKVAFEEKDPLCCKIFREAGQLLAKHTMAVADKINEKLKAREGGLPIVCMGSVFKSWKLLEPGFVEVLSSNVARTGIKEVTLYSLTKDASIGAAALGALAANKTLLIDYSKNVDLIFTGKF